MKKIIILLLCLVPLNVYAFDRFVLYQDELPLGDMTEMWLSGEGIRTIEGSFQDNLLFFQKFEQEVDIHEPISRGRFLNEVIKNLEVDYSWDLKEIPYSDLIEEDEYYSAIMTATDLGIVSGREDGTFKPYSPIIRAEAAKIVVEAFELSEELELKPEFSDLDEENGLYDYILSAYQAGIIKGYEDGTVRPKRDISYYQSEIIIDRALGEEIEPNFDWLGTYYRTFVPVDRKGSAGDYNIDFEINGLSESLPLKVLDVYFKENHYHLNADTFATLNSAEMKQQTWDAIYGAIDNMSEMIFKGYDFIEPTTGIITQEWGDKAHINGSYYGSHWGVDWANVTGTDIVAAQDGVVILAEFTPSYGGTVIIDHGEKISSIYVHLETINVEVGQEVEKAQVIAGMGSTGISTGPHLHFGIMIERVITNPWLFLK